MGRRKLEMKRIENKSSRLVTFSKRRTGLMKKARQLSVLCEVDVAVVVFSARGKLYEFCSSDANNSVAHLLDEYEKSCLEAASMTTEVDGHESCIKSRTCKELLQEVDRRLVEENNTDELSVAVTDMTQLEEELHAALVQTRSRKTQLMMDNISTLQEEERNLNKENEEIEKQMFDLQIASVDHIFGGEDEDEGEGEGGGLNDLATDKMNSPQHPTLSLFNP